MVYDGVVVLTPRVLERILKYQKRFSSKVKIESHHLPYYLIFGKPTGDHAGNVEVLILLQLSARRSIQQLHRK